MSAESSNKIAVFIGTHGEEMEVGGRLLQKLQTRPIDGIVHRIAHPEAVAAGKRYLGTSSDAKQIMSRYPGDPDGDSEQQAAYTNLQWLNEINPLVVFDVHETTISGSYIGMGIKISQAALAGSREFGYDRFVVEPSPFADSVPNCTYIENSLADSDPEVTAENLYKGLERLASVDLTKCTYSEATDNAVFYQKFVLWTAGKYGKLVSGLEQLEEIPIESQFSPLSLSPEQKKALGIPLDATTAYGSWGHDNMSKQVPERLGYTASGVPRREIFGSIMIQIAPPIPTGNGYLVFEKEKHSSAKNGQILKIARS